MSDTTYLGQATSVVHTATRSLATKGVFKQGLTPLFLHDHVRELCDQILGYLAQRNANPTRYVWKAKGEEILRKIHRAKQVLTV